MSNYMPIQNPWWRNPSSFEDDEKIQLALHSRRPFIPPFDLARNTILIGPRQVGKSTAVKLWIRYLLAQGHSPRNVMYFSCEPLSTKQELIDLLSAFDAEASAFGGTKFIFLDEVSSVDGWEQAIKFFVETDLGKTKQLVATGSNALLLKKGRDLLPGRNVDVRPFFPMSFREFLLHLGSADLVATLKQSVITRSDRFNALAIGDAASRILPFMPEIDGHLAMYLKTGGFLKPINEFIERGSIAESTYEVYVRWIVGDVLKYGLRELTFRSVIKGVLKDYTTRYAVHSLAKEMDIPSHVTASSYLDFLEGIFLIDTLHQVDPNQRVAVPRKEKKTYLTDPFLFSVFSGYVAGKQQDFSAGNEALLVEGMVCEALKRWLGSFFSTSSRLWFFAGKKETDFVVAVDDDALAGIEVKWQSKANDRDFANASLFKHRILLSKHDLDISNGMAVIPAAIFLGIIGI